MCTALPLRDGNRSKAAYSARWRSAGIKPAILRRAARMDEIRPDEKDQESDRAAEPRRRDAAERDADADDRAHRDN